jgi:hypothetical protein
MADLNTAALELTKALDATAAALKKYFDAAVAVGRESDSPTERGLDSKQVRRRLQAEVVARLSPRDGVLSLEGAPEARRYAAARPLLGLT